jgi:hypothetical protein
MMPKLCGKVLLPIVMFNAVDVLEVLVLAIPLRSSNRSILHKMTQLFERLSEELRQRARRITCVHELSQLTNMPWEVCTMKV